MAKAPRTGPPAERLRGLGKLEGLRGALPVAPYAARNADLEAVIAEDPDDAGRYLVYADWLQERDSPRGFLITLQHAVHQHPGDAARAEAASAQLREHHYQLLGRLEPYIRPRKGGADGGAVAVAGVGAGVGAGGGTSAGAVAGAGADAEPEVELDWFMGFIRGARLRLPSDARIAEALECLFETPSSVFLQELAIEPLEPRRDPDPAPIVALLLERGPRTLRRIRIGRPAAWQVPPELLAARPRLARDPAEVWAEVTAAIAKQRKLKIELDAGKLPVPVPRPALGGAAITADVPALLVGLKVELDKERPLGLLAALPQVFTRDSLDAFAVAMAREWLQLGEAAAKWSFDALGALGGDRTAALLGEHLARWSHARCVQALAHLGRIGTDAALAEIAALALAPSVHRPRREAAHALLGELAASRGLGDADRLIDLVCPAVPTLRVLDAQRWWLESLIVSGHRIAADDFARAVLDHPARRPLAETLVWGEFVGAKLFRMFRVSGGRMLQLAGDGAYELGQLGAKGHGLGLVHPAELWPADLEASRAAFAGVAQAVPQLERPVLRLTEHEAGKNDLTRFGGRIGFHELERALTARGWHVEDHGTGGGVTSFARELARDRVIAVAVLRETNGRLDHVVFMLRGTQPGVRRPDRLHAVTISEVLWDLEIAFGRMELPPDAPPPAPLERAPVRPRAPAPPAGPSVRRRSPASAVAAPPSAVAASSVVAAAAPPPAVTAPPPASAPRPTPVVERAKSGRSKCVVCGAAIAKDSLRIGIVRGIATPAFTGNATVWLHPSCRDGAPELAGITGLDDLLR
jgi:uncharacterized protein (TIGR02996 family)